MRPWKSSLLSITVTRRFIPTLIWFLALIGMPSQPVVQVILIATIQTSIWSRVIIEVGHLPAILFIIIIMCVSGMMWRGNAFGVGCWSPIVKVDLWSVLVSSCTEYFFWCFPSSIGPHANHPNEKNQDNQENDGACHSSSDVSELTFYLALFSGVGAGTLTNWHAIFLEANSFIFAVVVAFVNTIQTTIFTAKIGAIDAFILWILTITSTFGTFLMMCIPESFLAMTIVFIGPWRIHGGRLSVRMSSRMRQWKTTVRNRWKLWTLPIGDLPTTGSGQVLPDVPCLWWSTNDNQKQRSCIYGKLQRTHLLSRSNAQCHRQQMWTLSSGRIPRFGRTNLLQQMPTRPIYRFHRIHIESRL